MTVQEQEADTTPPPQEEPTPKGTHPVLAFIQRRWVLLLLALIGLTYVMPVIMILIGAFRTTAPGLGGDWTLDGVITAFTDPRTAASFRDSAILAVTVGATATAVASLFAWISTRTTVALRKLITPLMTILLVIPTLFFALAWDQLGKPNFGLLNSILGGIGLPENLINITGGWGVWFVMSLKVSSLAYFVLIGTFSRMDGQLEEASLMNGASKFRTFTKITLPVLSPSILGAFIVSAIIGLVALDAPLVIGLPAGFRPLSTQLYSLVRDDLPAQYGAAGTLAMIIVLIVLVMVALRWRLLEKKSFVTMTGKATQSRPTDLGKLSWLFTVLILVLAIIGVVLPSFQLLSASFQAVIGAGGALSLDNYATLFQNPSVTSALWNTLVLSVVGGALAVAVALLLGIVGRHSSTRVRRSLELVSWFPWSIYGVVLALGLLWAFLAIPFLRPFFGGILIVLIGLVISATPLASRAVEGSLAQIGPELEEAGRTSGVGPAKVTLGITIRLILPACLAAWLIAAINIAGNVDVPLLLAVPTNMPVSVLVYELYSNGQVTEAAALYCLLLGGAALIYLLLMGLIKIFGRGRNTVGLGEATQKQLQGRRAA